MKSNEVEVGTIVITKKNRYGIKANIKGVIKESSRYGVADVQFIEGHTHTNFPAGLLKKSPNQNQDIDTILEHQTEDKVYKKNP